jgi:hypothetical protein
MNINKIKLKKNFINIKKSTNLIISIIMNNYLMKLKKIHCIYLVWKKTPQNRLLMNKFK